MLKMANRRLQRSVVICLSARSVAPRLSSRPAKITCNSAKKMVQDSATPSKMNESEVERRKWSKPIMEKKRRERINRSLDELKKLVLAAQNRDSSRYTKLEKADILEMTVKHLRGLRNRQKNASAMISQNLIPGVNVGYCRCVTEVGHCVTQDNVVMETLERPQVMSHFVGISSNIQESLYIDANSRGPSPPTLDRCFSPGPKVAYQDSLHSQGLATSRVCRPLHVNTVAQFIPIRSSDVPNDHCVPGALCESSKSYCFSQGEPFWRPF